MGSSSQMRGAMFDFYNAKRDNGYKVNTNNRRSNCMVGGALLMIAGLLLVALSGGMWVYPCQEKLVNLTPETTSNGHGGLCLKGVDGNGDWCRFDNKCVSASSNTGVDDLALYKASPRSLAHHTHHHKPENAFSIAAFPGPLRVVTGTGNPTSIVAPSFDLNTDVTVGSGNAAFSTAALIQAPCTVGTPASCVTTPQNVNVAETVIQSDSATTSPAELSIEITNGVVTNIVVNSSGSGYSVGDKITISAAQLNMLVDDNTQGALSSSEGLTITLSASHLGTKRTRFYSEERDGAICHRGQQGKKKDRECHSVAFAAEAKENCREVCHVWNQHVSSYASFVNMPEFGFNRCSGVEWNAKAATNDEKCTMVMTQGLSGTKDTRVAFKGNSVVSAESPETKCYVYQVDAVVEATKLSAFAPLPLKEWSNSAGVCASGDGQTLFHADVPAGDVSKAECQSLCMFDTIDSALKNAITADANNDCTGIVWFENAPVEGRSRCQHVKLGQFSNELMGQNTLPAAGGVTSQNETSTSDAMCSVKPGNQWPYAMNVCSSSATAVDSVEGNGSFDHCAAVCREEENCIAFDFNGSECQTYTTSSANAASDISGLITLTDTNTAVSFATAPKAMCARKPWNSNSFTRYPNQCVNSVSQKVDTTEQNAVRSMSIEQCEAACNADATCSAYEWYQLASLGSRCKLIVAEQSHNSAGLFLTNVAAAGAPGIGANEVACFVNNNFDADTANDALENAVNAPVDAGVTPGDVAVTGDFVCLDGTGVTGANKCGIDVAAAATTAHFDVRFKINTSMAGFDSTSTIWQAPIEQAVTDALQASYVNTELDKKSFSVTNFDFVNHNGNGMMVLHARFWPRVEDTMLGGLTDALFGAGAAALQTTMAANLTTAGLTNGGVQILQNPTAPVLVTEDSKDLVLNLQMSAADIAGLNTNVELKAALAEAIYETSSEELWSDLTVLTAEAVGQTGEVTDVATSVYATVPVRVTYNFKVQSGVDVGVKADIMSQTFADEVASNFSDATSAMWLDSENALVRGVSTMTFTVTADPCIAHVADEATCIAETGNDFVTACVFTDNSAVVPATANTCISTVPITATAPATGSAPAAAFTTALENAMLDVLIDNDIHTVALADIDVEYLNNGFSTVSELKMNYFIEMSESDEALFVAKALNVGNAFEIAVMNKLNVTPLATLDTQLSGYTLSNFAGVVTTIDSTTVRRSLKAASAEEEVLKPWCEDTTEWSYLLLVCGLVTILIGAVLFFGYMCRMFPGSQKFTRRTFNPADLYKTSAVQRPVPAMHGRPRSQSVSSKKSKSTRKSMSSKSSSSSDVNMNMQQQSTLSPLEHTRNMQQQRSNQQFQFPESAAPFPSRPVRPFTPSVSANNANAAPVSPRPYNAERHGRSQNVNMEAPVPMPRVPVPTSNHSHRQERSLNFERRGSSLDRPRVVASTPMHSMTSPAMVMNRV